MIINRLAVSGFMLLVVSFACFLLVKILPGDYAEIILMHQMGGEIPTPEALAIFKRNNGLDNSITTQYADWLWKIINGNLGRSFSTGDSVINEITIRISNTFLVGFISLLISLVISCAIGITAAKYQGRKIDSILMTVNSFILAIPAFWLALILTLFFAVYLGWLPVSGYTTWKHLILPTFIIGISLSGVNSIIIRNLMIDVSSKEYIRMAKAKGLSERHIILRHMLPSVYPSILTMLGLQLGKTFDSVVVIETIFALPGIGRLFLDSILSRDFPVMQACMLVIGIVYIVINLLVDVLIYYISPELRSQVK